VNRRIRSYEAEQLVVEYDAKRCIHAEECVHGLPDVFDAGRRPWIDPSRATTADLVRTIERCPTGALHYRRRDGKEEQPPTSNTVRIEADGPLYIAGRLRITLTGGEIIDETRTALCRCGHSKDKPFCDNSHVEVGFADAGTIGDNRLKRPEGGEAGALEISPAPNGPLLVRGPFEIHSPEGATVGGASGALCRCGGSATKPFCDGAHKSIGFEAD
jgi:CDGSH-type Zn-finger protein/uncharacterized Fe-S cluster protein YjdI